jgi:hypothetical protein
MAGFLDFLLPQNSGLNPDQMDYMSRQGYINAAMNMADLSAPHVGPKTSIMQILTHGANGYQTGAQNALNQFYQNGALQTRGAEDAVQTQGSKEDLDWLKSHPIGNSSLAAANTSARQQLAQTYMPTMQAADVMAGNTGAGGMPLPNIPRNNPGNLKDPKTGQFRVFDTPDQGLAAMQADLTAKVSGNSPAMASAYGPNYTPTLANLISVYAPAGDHNNPTQYAQFVAQRAGLDPNQPLKPEDVAKVMPYMVQMENGPQAGQYAQQMAQLQPAAGNPQPSAQAIMANGTLSGPLDPRVDPQAGNKIYDYQGQKWIVAPNGQALNTRDTSSQQDPTNLASWYRDQGERLMHMHRPGGIEMMQMGMKADPQYNEPTFAQWSQMTPQQQQQYSQFKMAGQMMPAMMGGGNGTAQSGPTGDKLLKSLNPSISAQVKALAEGRQQFPSGQAMKTPYWQQMMQLVAQYDPNFDMVNYNARANTRKDFTSGPMANNITALNTAMAHAAALKAAYDRLDNTRFPVVNSVMNTLETQLGSSSAQANTSDVATKGHALAEELAKVFRSQGMAESDIRAWESKLDTSATKAQSDEVLNAAMDLIDGRLQALGARYNQGMGTTKDPMELLSPEAQKAYASLRGNGQPAATAPQEPTQGPTPQGWTIKRVK